MLFVVWFFNTENTENTKNIWGHGEEENFCVVRGVVLGLLVPDCRHDKKRSAFALQALPTLALSAHSKNE
jgi:hypothetical protein